MMSLDSSNCEAELGSLRLYNFQYFIARPVARPTCMEQWRRWRQFLLRLVLECCAEDQITLIYGSPEVFNIWVPGGAEFNQRGPSGKAFRIYELPRITAQIVQEYIIEAPQFDLGDMLIWKPRQGHSGIQGVLAWRQVMSLPPLPFSHIVATDQCIGFPSDDGEWFYWMNPEIRAPELASIAQAHGVNVFF